MLHIFSHHGEILFPADHVLLNDLLQILELLSSVVQVFRTKLTQFGSVDHTLALAKAVVTDRNQYGIEI